MKAATACQAACLPILLLWSCARPRQTDPAALLKQAVNLQQRGQYQEALNLTREGLRAASAAQDTESVWRLRLAGWEVMLSQGQHKQVAAEFPAAIPLDVPRSAELEARRLMIAGRVADLQGKRAQAVALLNRAAALSRETGPVSLRAMIELLRGFVVDYTADPDSAEAYFRSAAHLARQAGDRYVEANAFGNIGFLRLNQARYEEALYWFEQAMPPARQIGSRSVIALSTDNIGWCYFRLGDYDKAARYFEEAAPMFKSMGKTADMQIALGNIGSVWFSRGDYPTAARYYSQALAIAESIEDVRSMSDWLINLAVTAIEQGDFEKAEAYNRRARSLPHSQTDRRSEAWLTVNEGRIAEHRDNRLLAQRLYRAAIESRPAEPTVELEARANLARLYQESGQYARANAEYRALLDRLNRYRSQLSEGEWRISWLSALMRFYRDYVRFLWRQGRTREALEVAESSRARVLADRFGRPPDARLPSASKMMLAARRSGCTLASYWLAPQESYLWLVTSTSVKAYRLPAREQIATDIATLRRFVESMRDPLESGHPAIARLAEALTGPLRSDSAGCVLLSPDQELHTLNFEMLPVPGTAARYWIEEKEIRVVPSLALALPPPRLGQASALLLGDPVSPNETDYPNLQHASAELEFIESLWRPSPTRKLVRESAHPDAYRNANPHLFELIHIAAHAVANRDNPFDSAIILSRANERHLLTAREIASVPVRARLVTISACHSAGTKAYAGEGAIGFAWAFLHAGARSVIAGLWAVDDAASARLMREMYEAIRRGRSPSSALRQAKLSFIRSGASLRKPFYWAPLQIYTTP